jgi:hypothetical protein
MNGCDGFGLPPCQGANANSGGMMAFHLSDILSVKPATRGRLDNLHFQAGEYSVTFRIQARPGQCSKMSEAIAVVRYQSVPPTPGTRSGNAESGSSASTCSTVESGRKGRTTDQGFNGSSFLRR